MTKFYSLKHPTVPPETNAAAQNVTQGRVWPLALGQEWRPHFKVQLAANNIHRDKF